jgi:DNA-binding transcriptional ArsR family regulator
MGLIQIYQCFCDRTRLRILYLLTHSPLCVCHFQDILVEPQVKISKHLAYLRSRGLVMAARDHNWMIYSLPKRCPPELASNLKCLQECAQSDAVFKRDLQRLMRLQKNCCEPGAVFGKTRNRSKPDGKTKNPIHLRS